MEEQPNERQQPNEEQPSEEYDAHGRHCRALRILAQQQNTTRLVNTMRLAVHLAPRSMPASCNGRELPGGFIVPPPRPASAAVIAVMNPNAVFECEARNVPLPSTRMHVAAATTIQAAYRRCAQRDRLDYLRFSAAVSEFSRALSERVLVQSERALYVAAAVLFTLASAKL